MLRKIVDSAASFGLVALLVGGFYYSVTGVWDWRSQAAIYGGGALVLVYLVMNIGRLRQVLSSRAGRYGSAALGGLLLVVGILVLVNFLNSRHHKRIDLSEGALNALSPQTGKVLGALEADIDVIGFFTEEPEAKRFQDLMNEYRYISDRVKFEVVDPQKDPSRVSQFQITRRGQVVVTSGAKRETIEDVNEEKLTNAIIKVTRDEEKVIYFLTGHGERELTGSGGEGYSTVESEIEKQNYRVEAYNLAQENKLPENATVIVSAGPKVNFFPNEVQLLEQYLAQGGKLFLLLDPETDFQMDDFLATYGVKVDNDIIVDASGLGQLFGLGAAAPLVADYTDHPVTRELENTMTIFPFARSLETTTSQAGYTTTVLMRTSARSWGETELGSQSVSFDEGKDREGPLALAIASVKPAETPKPDAGKETGTDEGAASGGEADASGDSAELESTNESRVVVFGDSDFASNAYFGSSVNGDLFLNVLSWMAQDADLISVRPKEPTSRSITLTGTESKLIFWGSVVLFPLATFVFGLAVWIKRR